MEPTDLRAKGRIEREREEGTIKEEFGERFIPSIVVFIRISFSRKHDLLLP